jgi:RNase H-fold protein (predicted Holliday junction resolvase)
VLGESLDLSGQKNEIMQEIEIFKKNLAELRLPIHYEKEFLTSVEARGRSGKEKNNARKTKTKTTKTKVDDMAAALILQRYLDKINKEK